MTVSTKTRSSRYSIPVVRVEIAQATKSLRYNLRSIWLFTYSDIKTIWAPKTIFGTLSALAAPSFGFATAASPSTPIDVLRRVPLTAFWIWINLLPFDIDNQRHDVSIEEDRINKPWRVLPSGRMNPKQARKLMLCLYCIAAFVSGRIGGVAQCLGLMALGYWYNDLGGSDTSCIIRNFINGLGYNCFASGATEVALGMGLLPYTNVPLSLSEMLNPARPDRILFWKWVAILVTVITTTAHAQDIHDQEGDSLRGRHTVPLVIGDVPARVSMVIGVWFWTFTCCLFWNVGIVPYLLIGSVAATVSARTMLYRSVKSDKKTFLIWNGWVTTIYMLPVLKLWF
ncbi:hypothetical protein CC80DRAFT_593774 [Byssothecium circinans]|uniref:UbiA prenyltransferase n=1 Tax=Byssothecium circinans TaxID=147558 RepID=A0A6A5U5A7_9PLEO|nr:hypothetical protein CC80DRAFT_593774 [Byssothecium circinans]